MVILPYRAIAVRNLDSEFFLHDTAVFLFETQLNIHKCFGPFRDFTFSSKTFLSALNSLSFQKSGFGKCRSPRKRKSSTRTGSSLRCVNDRNHQLNLWELTAGENSPDYYCLIKWKMHNKRRKTMWVCRTRLKFYRTT